MKIVFDRWLNSEVTRKIFDKYDVNSIYFKKEFEKKFVRLFNKLDTKSVFEIVEYFEEKSITLNDLLNLLENLKYSFEKSLPPLIEKDFFALFKLIISKFNRDKETKQELIKLNTLLNEYKKAVDESNIVSKTDLNGRITYINHKFCEISGYTERELIGKPHNIVRHPDMPSSAFKELWETIKAKKIWNGVVKNLKKDGNSYYVDATIIPILDENGDIVEYMGIRHDVTELILKTEEIEELKLKQMRENVGKAIALTIKSTIKNMPIPTIIIDSEDFIVSFNEEFEAIFDMLEDRKILKSLKNNDLNLRDIFDEIKLFSQDKLINWKDEVKECMLSLKEKNVNCKLKLKKIEECEEDRYIINLIFEDFLNAES